MDVRRAKAFESILTTKDICIQDWDRIVGSSASMPKRLYFEIDITLF